MIDEPPHAPGGMHVLTVCRAETAVTEIPELEYVGAVITYLPKVGSGDSGATGRIEK